ncbi:unnamed protein product [Dibothriocephalus latus]|uniref:Uncharacterized protein n=1 Tax=Dibothriocephalus latus TaxID=60516 RepID=A0A3P7M3F9_DIBLA|nr:unnamed protein product [Dibothriocephalus latus]
MHTPDKLDCELQAKRGIHEDKVYHVQSEQESTSVGGYLNTPYLNPSEAGKFFLL